MGRTDTHILVVCNNTTGQRYSQAGLPDELEKLAAEQKKAWKGDKLEVIIQKR